MWSRDQWPWEAVKNAPEWLEGPQRDAEARPPQGPWGWGWILAALGLIAAIVVVVNVAVPSLPPRLPDGGVDGGDGVGDPYLPDAGGGGYDAVAYRIDLNYDEPHQALAGSTMVFANATENLSAFHVDLGLDVERASVNGEPAEVRQQGWDVLIVPAQAIAASTEFSAEIFYHGRPLDPATDCEGAALVKGRELLIANEPRSAPCWFPSNDHPRDKAQMDVTVTVPSDLQIISVGRLASRDQRGDPATDTWHWISTQPMATYLNFLTIGQFQIEEGRLNERPFVYAASLQLPADTREPAMAALRRTPTVIAELEQLYGPYQLSEYGGLATALEVPWGALETQPRPIYAAGYLARSPDRLLSHELAHMWFGDVVTVREWNDIFINEAYASYTEWLYAERHDGLDPNRAMRETYDRTSDDFWRIRMGDPGVDHMFDTVYRRGPMALQALRNLIGDEAFFSLARDWVAYPATRSLEDWQEMAQRHTSVDLRPYFEVWLAGTTRPAATAENGFR